jgi:UDP-N-acetylglucosamine 1-carboxyvinyltransferase
MEDVIVIEGNNKLEGEVKISGSKNATVALIPAAILANTAVTIVGVPQISDVHSLSKILEELGVKVDMIKEDHLIIDPSKMKNVTLDSPYVSKLRASYYLMGALLGKYKKVKMKMPGGCYLGPRPIDLHLKGFEALGAKVIYDKGYYIIEAEELYGAKIFLDVSSVGATINIMMAAVYANGRTTIENAAKEPEIIDVSSILNKMGAQIRGAGTGVITIDGVKELHGCFHEIIPDRIEASTFLIIAAAAAKDMKITNIIPAHMESLISKLTEMNVNMEVSVDSIHVKESNDIKAVDIKTLPYPGFATDAQQPLVSLLTKAQGSSKIVDTIYPERFKNCLELQRMGATIDVGRGNCEVTGPCQLNGDIVTATDLRCGAGLVVAGLISNGKTTIREIYHIDRGYEKLDEKLRAVGANIYRDKIEL